MATGKLNALCYQCTLLSSSKITEQNKGLDGIKLHLQDSDVTCALNATESKKGPSWNYIFQVIFEFFRQESVICAQNFSSWTATKKANKIKKLQDVFGVIRTCIRVANTGEVRLSKLSTFVEFLITMLNDKVFMSLPNYCNTLLSALAENILVERKFYCDFSTSTFNSLYEICKKYFGDIDDGRKFSAVTLLCALTKALVLQADCSNYSCLHELFIEFGKSLKHLNSNNIRDNVISSINLYVKWISLTNRTMACQLGEECFDTILGVWMGNTLPDSTLKLIVEFCTSQLHLHNPGGNVTYLTGAFARDSSTWHQQIFMIFQAVEMQLNKQSSLYRFKNDKDKTFNEGCINLAACACFLLFQLHANESFQASSEQLSSLPSSKIDFDDASSLSLLYTVGKDKQVTFESKYWLQILHAIMESHLHFFNLVDGIKVISKLRTFLLSANLDSVGSFSFECVSILMKHLGHCFSCDKISAFPEIFIIWKDCWNIASNYLAQSNKQLMADSAFNLLSSLVEFDRMLGFNTFITSGCSKNMHTLWSSIYMHAPPRAQSLRFVALFVESYGFSCSAADNTLYKTLLLTTSINANFEDTDLKEKEPFKALLLLWLLGYREEVITERNNKTSNNRMNATQSNSDDVLPPKPMISLQLLNANFSKKCVQVEEIANFLLHVCAKNNSSEKFIDVKQGFVGDECYPMSKVCLANQFPDFDSVAFAKHMYLTRPDLDKDDKPGKISTSEALPNRSFHAHLLEFTSKFLLSDLQVLATRINEVQDDKNLLNLDKLCHSLFMIANISGHFLNSLVAEKLRTEREMTFFEEWIKSTFNAVKMIMRCVRKWTSVQQDFNFMSLLFTEVKNVVVIFFSLFSVLEDKKFENIKQNFQALVNEICEFAITMLKPEKVGKDLVPDRVTGNLLDDIQTQVATNPSAGYKRRRYDGGNFPTAKQKRFSLNDNDERCICTCDDALCDCTIFHNSAISLLCTAISSFSCCNLFNEVFSSVLCLDVSVFLNLRMVYKILIQLSTCCKDFQVEDLTSVMDVFENVFHAWYKDQYVCSKFLSVFSKLLFASADCTDSEKFSTVFDKAAMILKTFWSLKIKGKCAPNVRQGVLSCFAPMLMAMFRKQPSSSTDLSMPSSQKNLNLYDPKLICSALLSFLSDNNEGIKFSCGYFVDKVFSQLRDCNELEVLQKDTLTCLSKLAEKFFNSLDSQSGNVENMTSFLSASLHVLLVCFPPRSTEIEESVHYQLCEMSCYCAKHNLDETTSKLCNYLLLGFFKHIALGAFKGKKECQVSNKKLLFKYTSRHMQSIFSRWIEGCDVSLQMNLFPYALFGCGSMQEFFHEHMKKIFPVLFIYCRNKDELESVVKQHSQKKSMKDITKACAAEVISLILSKSTNKGNTSTNQIESRYTTMVDKIFQSENNIFALCRLHFAQILIDVIMTQGQTDNLTAENNHLHTKIGLLLKYCFSNPGEGTKHNQSLDKLAGAVFCCRSDGCVLVEVLKHIRRHVAEAWLPYELCHKLKMYKFLISTLLQAKKIPDMFFSYLVKDVVYFLSFFVHSIREKFKMTSEVASKKAVVNITIVCLEVFIMVCEYVKRRQGSTNSFMHWNIAVPFVSSIAVLKSFFGQILTMDSEVKDIFQSVFIEKLDSVMALTLTMQDCRFLQHLLSLIGWSEEVLSFSSCLELFLNSFRILKEHDLLQGNNPLINVITEYLEKGITMQKSGEHHMDNTTLKDKMDAMRCLTSLPSYGCCNTSVFDCIAVLGMLLPKSLNLEERTLTCEEAKLELIRNILQILSRQVVSVEFQITKNASNCLYHFFQLQDKESYCKQIKEDQFLFNTLLPFQVELVASLQTKVVPKSIGELKNYFSDIKGFNDMPFKNWICSLTCKLASYCKDSLFHIIMPACSYDDTLCTAILPAVFYDLLVNDPTGKVKQYLSSFVQGAFDSFLLLYKDAVSMDITAMQTFLGVLKFLRCQNMADIEVNLKRRSSRASDEHPPSNSWDNNFWLDINYLSAANVAVSCGHPFEAVLYIEIWKECRSNENVSQLTNGVSSACRALLGAYEKVEKPEDSNHSAIDLMEDEKYQCEEILIKAFSAIDDVDSLFGLRKDCREDSKIMMHIHEQQTDWFEALHAYNSQAKKVSSKLKGELPYKILSALESSGLQHISEVYKTGIILENSFNNGSSTLVDIQYQSAEKASKWEDDDEYFKQRFSNCVTLMMDEDISTLSVINRLQIDVTTRMSTFNKGSFIDGKVTSSLSNLMSLRDLTQVFNAVTRKDLSMFQIMLCHWEKFSACSESIMAGDYNCAFSILSNRDSFLNILQTKFTDRDLDKKLRASHERIQSQQICFMINKGRENVALQKISDLKSLKTNSSTFGFHKLVLEEAQLLWKIGKRREAITISANLEESLKNSVINTDSEKFGNTFLLGKALLLRGQWLNSSKMEGPSTIMERYFKKSVEIAERFAGKKDGQRHVDEEDLLGMRISGYKILAKFADDQYQDVINYMKSSEFEHKRELFRDAQKEMRSAENKDGQNQKYMILLKKNSNLDHKDLQNILEKKETFLLCALQNYINCLSLSDENDILIYRVCALWFANTQSASVPGLMECACKHIKTHKFVQTAYQLAARLNSSSSDIKLQAMLQDLLYRMAIDHPHHVLSVLLALANAQRDAEILRGNTKRGIKSSQSNSTSIAAKAVVAKVKSSRPHHVSLLEEFSNAYIQLANYDASRWAKMQSVPIKFDKNLLIVRYCASNQNDKYSALAIPTVEIPVDKTCSYKENANFVSLNSFKPYFSLIGGINLPKIVIAIGSDGKERKHLVKGKDDLRQDAVMQQVFKVVNNLLFQQKSPKTLQLRTYKVVPLSQRSGLVEWCDGTIPIGTYLIGTPALKDYGAHHRYRPNDNKSLECRRKLSAAASKPLHQKLESFKDICNNFKPVFRHFFYEHFMNPVTWFNRRSAYCKSVACSSIVGYILGLGDRHVQNILVDRSSGEVIHIDLGVAFEQGRCLPTPEMVPFRLTRDMVDGFGSVGVEGPFRKNCERTMAVLRESIDTISTIVEVLLYDPLHDWMMTSGKALQLQRNTGTNFESEMTSSILNASTVAELLNETVLVSAPVSNQSSLAGRAMLRVQEKLRGLESGAVLSVEGQINLLIQQATDPERLCAMFAGWQPYI